MVAAGADSEARPGSHRDRDQASLRASPAAAACAAAGAVMSRRDLTETVRRRRRRRRGGRAGYRHVDRDRAT